MPRSEIRRHSRWIMRTLEWDETRARYPNVWFDDMPRHVLAQDRWAERLRLGDLIAVYYPKSAKHPERSERFLGLCRVVGLRRADAASFCWIDLEAAHRLERAFAPDAAPERVVLCCDPGWPAAERALFQSVFDAARAEGWRPAAGDDAPSEAGSAEAPTAAAEAAAPPADAKADAKAELTVPVAEPRTVNVEPPREVAARPADREDALPAPSSMATRGRLFAGAHFSGDMRDPRRRTWLAVVSLVSSETDEALHVVRLDATGRHGLQALLRDPQRDLMHAEAVGLAFPFGLPIPFAEKLMGGPFPEEGWWALARRLESMKLPEFLVALQEFRDSEGELRRLVDERAEVPSPLHRVDPDLGSRCFHGIRMIAEDRSRYAIRPFETAQGKLLFEVSPSAALARLGLHDTGGAGDSRAIRERIADGLAALDAWPVRWSQAALRDCLASRDALDSVVAARSAALAVLTDEANRTPDDLAPDAPDRVRREGWIYGL